MLRKIIFGVFLLISIFTYAQQFPYKIKGKITDANYQPVGEAIIQTSENQIITSISEKDGTFEISVPSARISLKIKKMGFKEQIIDIEAFNNENRTTYANIVLQNSQIELQEVVVSDNPSLVTNSRQGVEQKLNAVSGGVILSDLSSLKTQRSQTLKDAIGKESGVIIQEFFGGNDQPRLNIRGSGIQSNPQSHGWHFCKTVFLSISPMALISLVP